MNEKLHELIIKAAKNIPMDDKVPYAFEKRVMHNLLARGETEKVGHWGRLLWRAALPCLFVMMATGAWSSFYENNGVWTEGEESDLEYVVLEPVNLALEETW